MTARRRTRWLVACIAIVLPLGAVCSVLARNTDQSTQGFLKRTYTAANGETSHYIVFVPHERPANQKLPVILFLNGWGENGVDGLRQISNNFGGDLWRMRGHFPFLAVCPQCSYHGSWATGTPNSVKALAILEAAIRTACPSPGLQPVPVEPWSWLRHTPSDFPRSSLSPWGKQAT
jgi:poly(3-hydroxybutyrate) depolymerase